MQNFSLVRWLKENSELGADIIDSLQFELDNRIYFYGKQFASPYEQPPLRQSLGKMKFWAKEKLLLQKKAWAQKPVPGRVKISSNAYFPFNNLLSENGFEASPAPWQMGPLKTADGKADSLISKVKFVLRFGDFKDLISPEFISDLTALKKCLKVHYERENIEALVVPYDMPVFERMAVNVFKELGRPSIVALHGLPGRYNKIDDNRADYLFVWGERIKELYIRAGVPADKIFITGHPKYSSHNPTALSLPSSLRFSLDNILIITKAMNGAQHGDEEVLTDRGNLILYLFSIRQALRKIGVQQVKLRVHPSESAEWYRSFLDTEFFKFDKSPFGESISQASLVIGPMSTVFVDCILAGVNYLVYEPTVNGDDLINYPIVPPFDGSEPRVPTAHTEQSLCKLLSERKSVVPGVINDYIKTPFDLSYMKKILCRQV